MEHDHHKHPGHPCDAEHPPDSGAGKGVRSRARKLLYGNMTVLGILSLVWLLVRSGRKPSRLTYPCQRAALANAAVLLTGAAVPIAAHLPRFVARERVERRPWVDKLLGATEMVAVVAVVVAIVLTITGTGGAALRSMNEMRSAAAGLVLPELRSTSPTASNIYVAENIPTASEHGVDYLIQVMAGNGLHFFKSNNAGAAAAAPDGMIGKNDIVLIKVNGEWQYRGGTNTDVVKGLINAIVHHPDGFTGEIVIVENGQWASFMDNRPDNQNPSNCNAEDHAQSFNDVAKMYAAGGSRVSVYDWTAVQTNDVNDYDKGDMRDGYVYVPEIEEGYPKFTTVYGTKISLRNGQWTGAGYDSSRVKMLNVPVLKDHGNVVTNAVKHWMGVQDLWQRTQNAPHTPMITQGIFGKVMLKSHFPELNISDCIWVTPANGPNGPYDKAVRLDRLVASQDPIALDYYCSKYVLMPVSGNAAQDPNGSNQWHQMLSTTRDVLAAGGKQVTMDEGNMNVYKVWAPDKPPVTKYEYFLSEGCTAYGFETWVLVANPNGVPAKVDISYFTDNGPVNKDPVTVPPHSRLTVNASSDIWAMNAGVRVGSDQPVYIERAMYWNDRTEGHDSIGTATGSTDWYVADGHTADGFETWIEILNPSPTDCTASLTYMTPGGIVGGPKVLVPGYARRTVFVADTVNNSDVSTHITSDRPVVVERSMYWNGRRGGSGSNAVKVPAQDWYLAEGATHSGFETYVLLLNPGTTNATANLEFLTAKGTVKRDVPVPAGTRRTVKLNDIVPGLDVSTYVHSDVPLVAERSMLWPVPGGRAGHATVGMTSPATEIFMPEGCTAYGFDTWLLLENPGAASSSVSVWAMTEGGEQRIAGVDVAGRSRKTLKLNDYYQGNLSIRVVSTQPICAERSVYWNNKGGGTSSIGY